MAGGDGGGDDAGGRRRCGVRVAAAMVGGDGGGDGAGVDGTHRGCSRHPVPVATKNTADIGTLTRIFHRSWTPRENFMLLSICLGQNVNNFQLLYHVRSVSIIFVHILLN